MMVTDLKPYLSLTTMLNYNHETIQTLIDIKQWRKLSTYDAIGAIYTYVRDEIHFGYNADDRLSASQVLKDGYGQCNTKGTLLMALFRALDIPCRLHGFTIHNALQCGAIPKYLLTLAPPRIIHSWVEIYFEHQWLNLEGYIIDNAYLSQVQHKFKTDNMPFSGYGIATDNLIKPDINWRGRSTYIQRNGIADDFGIYTQPDDFYHEYGSNLRGIKKLAFRFLLRHLMNANVNKIRLHGI
jgi:hypothetical protein